MPLSFSTPVQIQTATAQYLFRVYHIPKQSVVYERWNYEITLIEDETPAGWPGVETIHNDHLFSVPATKSDLVDIANRLAYGESLLYVKSKIMLIVAWMVTTTKGIDRRTPCLIYHPFRSSELRANVALGTAQRAASKVPFPNFPALVGGASEPNLDGIRGFQSYDIVSKAPLNTHEDCFKVLEVARQTRSGRAKKQTFQGVVCSDDYYWSGNTLMFNSKGSLNSLRFPAFAETLAAMQFTHSSWDIDESGKISLGREALTHRVANRISNHAQRRRMYILRSPVTTIVMKNWYDTVAYVSERLYYQDEFGWAERRVVYTAEFPPQPKSYTCAPHQTLESICQKVADFINVVGVACGSNSLLFGFRSTTSLQQQTVWHHIHDDLLWLNRGNEPLAQKPDTLNDKVILGILDILGSIAEALHQHAEEINNAQPLITGNLDVPWPVLNCLALCQAQNKFALDYARLQGEAIALLGLLCTWQYTFHPVEATRSTSTTGAFKTRRVKDVPAHVERWDARDAHAAIESADFEGRVLEYVPVMSPFRVWDAQIPQNDYEREQEEEKEELERETLRYIEEQKETDEEMRRYTRKQARQHEIDLEKAKRLSNGANPLDVWTYENWMNREWWVTTIAPADVPEFLYHAIDTPSFVDTAINVFKVNPRVAVGIRRLEPLISGVEEFVTPHRRIRAVLKNPYFRMIVKEGAKLAARELSSRIQGAVMDRTQEQIFSQHPDFEARVFWPPAI